MRGLLHLVFGSPLRAAILIGLAVALGLGLASFPQAELVKSAADLNFVNLVSGPDAERLRTAYDAARAGDGELVTLSEDEFEARALPFATAFPAGEQSGRKFVIRHVGQAQLSEPTVYVWEETIFAAPWWSPHRFVYKALKAEVGQFGEVVSLTFERDVPGLVGLLFFDAIMGILYGAVIGLIVRVLRNPLEAPELPERA